MINNFLQRFDILLAQPFWLWLLLLLPFYYYFSYRKQNEIKSYWRISNLPQNFTTSVPNRVKFRPLLNWLRMLVLFCGIVALARPQKTDSFKNIDAEGIDIILSIDISGSMMDKDFEPNRLEATKKTMIQFVKERPGDRIGLVIFAGESFTQCPVTLDHKILIEQIGMLRSDLLAPGTSLGNGLATAVGGLKDGDGKSKVVVLMTDGVQMTGAASTLNVLPEEAADMAQIFGIKVYTIGIGSKGVVLRPTLQEDGSVIDMPTETDLNEDLLQNIADKTGGRYFRATDNNSLNEIYSEIDKLEKSKVEMSTHYQYEDLYYWILIPGLLLLLLEQILRMTYFKTVTEE